MTKTSTLLLLATLASTSPAWADDTPRARHAAPDAGQAVRQIQDQQLVRNLGDGLSPGQASGPDPLYQVVDGGMPLPPGLCERTQRGCRSGGSR